MKTVIIEDETAATANLEAVLGKVAPDAEVIATLESIAESVEWFESHDKPDLVFMDIHLADGNAFRIFDHTEIEAPIIFTTAYDEYAIEAFKVNSIDYILKPIKEADLHRALEKMRRLTSADVEHDRRNIVEAARREKERTECNLFLIHVKDRMIPLRVEEIAFCYTCDEKVWAYASDGRVLPLDKTLETLSGMLSEEEFFRANRQFIVSRRAIRDITVWFGSRLSLNLTIDTPEKIIISKARVPEFKRWFTGIQRS